MTFPGSGSGRRMRPPCFSPQANPARDFRFPVQTDQRRRWRQAQNREVLRFVSLAPHSLPTGGRCAQGISARASLATSNRKFQRRISYGSTALFGNFRAGPRATNQSRAYRQARMNSRNLFNIATLFAHRQPSFIASHRPPELRPGRDTWRLKSVRAKLSGGGG
jgi:hypothetical protein